MKSNAGRKSLKIDVLDHGDVEYIDAWGMGREGTTDFEVGIIEAARQSTQGSFRGWDEDHKLLKFLHDNRHATPFEFAGLVIEVQAPPTRLSGCVQRWKARGIRRLLRTTIGWIRS